jgi:hypothetical protein
MNEPAATLFPTTNNNYLRRINLRKFFIINRDCISNLSVFITLVERNLMHVDWRKKIGNVEVV